jgi:hypothetical protein
MPWTGRVGPRDGDEDALWLAVREVVPPGQARFGTSYGAATGRSAAERAPGRVLDRRVRRRGARGRSLPSRRATVASYRATGRAERQRWSGEGAGGARARRQGPVWRRTRPRSGRPSGASRPALRPDRGVGRFPRARRFRPAQLQMPAPAPALPRRPFAGERAPVRPSVREALAAVGSPPGEKRPPAGSREQRPASAAPPAAAEADRQAAPEEARADRGSREGRRSSGYRGGRTAPAIPLRRSGRSCPPPLPPRSPCPLARRSTRDGPA